MAVRWLMVGTGMQKLAIMCWMVGDNRLVVDGKCSMTAVERQVLNDRSWKLGVGRR